jgi:FixJ family two-component response regulator
VADLRMPGLSGLDLQEELRKRGLDLPIVFISGRADVASGVRAMKGGAVDFLQKPVSERDLFEAIRHALEEARERHSERSDRAALETRAARLTPREREVFGLVASGLPNKRVGAELGATEKTIKVHRARVMEKMEAGSLAELVRMADRLGLRGQS